MRRWTFLTTAVLLILFAAGSRVALAAPGHQARLSADLQDHLSAATQAIEIIVHGNRATVDALAARYNVTVTRYFANDGAVLRVTAGQLAAMRDDEGIDHISGDVPIKASDAVTAEAIGADQVWAGTTGVPGLNGSGVVVAVIDSGIDPTHAALRDRIVATHDFTGGDGVDRFGHGTHVAGLIAGVRVATPDGRDYEGIAWGARLVNLRVLDGRGTGTVSNVVDAIDWAIANRERYEIRVINLSLGAPVLQSYHDDPLCEAVERAIRAGIVVVAAAGNYGRTTDGKTVFGSITSPANDPLTIAVGAIDTHGTADRSDDTIAGYSSRGPTAYDLVLKPDVSAPGQHLVSAEAANSYLATTYPARHITGEGRNAYFDLSGTSMSAAVVSGAAALVLEGRRHLSVRETKAVIELTASFMPQFGLLAAGAGNLNVLAATEFARPQDSSKGEGIEQIETLLRQEPEAFTFFCLPRKPSIAEPITWGNDGKPIVCASVSLMRVSNPTALSIVWGVGSSSIVWGVTSTSIVWGVTNSSIVWGVTGDTVPPSVDVSSIVWGVGSASIVWGIDGTRALWVDPNSIVWG